MVHQTQNGPTLTTLLKAHSLHRGDQIVYCGQALVIARHPIHGKGDGTVRVDLQYPNGDDYGPGVWPLNGTVDLVIGGRTAG